MTGPAVNLTRRQFGAIVGAGMVMLLPKVANAVAVKTSARARRSFRVTAGGRQR